MSKTFDELLESVNVGDTVTGFLREDLLETHHQELQKARASWLREEIVKLEGEKLGVLARPIFVGANAPERMRIHNQALQTIIDRYQSELDQPITSDKTNGL